MKRSRRIDTGRSSGWLDDNEDVNPMNYISNLSDAMLVLAVGMMLALVVAWNVDISSTAPGASDYGTYVEGATMTDEVLVLEEDETVTSDDTTSDSDVGEFGLSEYGTVYVDKDGNFYVVEGETP